MLSPIPVIADCHAAFGNNLNAVYAVQQFEAAGIAAVCFEDKQFQKMNSFVGAGQHLEQIDTFARKIKVAKEAQTTKDFMIIARTEALGAGCDVSEALKRAHAYADAGADANSLFILRPKHLTKCLTLYHAGKTDCL